MDDSGSLERESFLAEIELYFERNEVQTALNFAQSRLKKMPEDISSRIVICRAWLIQGRIDEAREMLAELEKILSDLSRLYECMGDLYSKKGLEKEAEMFYRKFSVLESKPSLLLNIDIDTKPDVVEKSAEAEEYDNNGIPPDFETVTLAELYMRQGHYQMAQDLLVKIVNRETTDDRAARLLKDVRDRLSRGQNHVMNEEIVKKLSRWLDNIRSLRRNA